MWFDTINTVRERYPRLTKLKSMRLCGRSRQSLYYKQKLRETEIEIEKKILKQLSIIKQRMPKIGCKKLYFLIKPFLESNSIKMGRDKFFDILRKHDILKPQMRRSYRTTDSSHDLIKYPNLIKNMDCNRSEQIIVSDITYLRVENMFYFLTLICDYYSKKIIGYCVADNLRAENNVKALKMALSSIQTPKGMYHHSDRGSQYCSDDYTELLKKNNILISMTETGDPRDNGVAERLNGILKQEFLPKGSISNKKELYRWVINSIHTYNNFRPHLSCGMLTPTQAHNKQTGLKKLWKTKKRTLTEISIT